MWLFVDLLPTETCRYATIGVSIIKCVSIMFIYITDPSQPAFTGSKLTIETLEQGV